MLKIFRTLFLYRKPRRTHKSARFFISMTYLYLFTLLIHNIAFADSKIEDSLKTLEIEEVESSDILYINDEIKSWLDKNIAPIRRSSERATVLHERLFHPGFRGIRYDSQATRTALDTWKSGAGNCVSLAALYVASARYVGLNAKFQTVKIPRQWLDEEDFYIIPTHVNAAIKLPNERVTVEFANIYSAERTQDLKSKKISDKRLFAEFYNNLGMENLSAGNTNRAIAYLSKSIQTYKKIGFVWSNLGVAFKQLGLFEEAEYAYKKSLKISPSNLSTINNLFVLYSQTERLEEREKLRKKVEKYSRQNPFYLYRLASTDLGLKNYDSAIQLLKQALRKKPDEAKFHEMLGKSYFQAGNFDKSLKSINRAMELSGDQESIDRYQNKLDSMKKLRAGR